MTHEKISSEVIETERQEQEEKQEIQQQLAISSNGGRVQKAIVDEANLQEFIGKVVNEWGAAVGALITFVGDRLGLFTAMAGADELTSEQLANKTGTHPRIIKEWLAGQAAGGFVTYNRVNDTYTLSDEHAIALTNENSPAYVAGFYQSIVSLFKDEEKIIEAFKTGKGLGWGDHHHYLFEGTERFFKPNYVANLITSWIPALEGIENKLINKRAKVADVGCGHGVSTILMAKAYPNSKIVGFDLHKPSIEWARRKAEKEGLQNITFEVANSTDYPGDDYDLVTFFDCFHDMGDPAEVARHVLQTLKKKDGTWMLVEPFANDKLEDNLNPLGRVFYSVSSVVCVPASLNENGPALGAQAGEDKIAETVKSAGFSKFRQATQTPFNLVFEARP
jgi:2-polyprenyl-3-methyl-5-hydroxy-6-metoxy-1,4-benzoquinol methylase